MEYTQSEHDLTLGKDLLKNDRKYRDLANSLPHVIAEIDMQGNVLFANEISFMIFGYDKDDLKRGLNIAQMIAPEDHDRMTKNIERLLKGQRRDNGGQYTAVRRDGSRIPVIIYLSPILKQDTAVGFTAIVIDNSEQRTLEEIFRTSEAKYKIIFETTGTGMLIFKEDMTISLANSTFEHLSGYTKHEIEGIKKLTEFIHEDDRQKVIEHHRQRRINPDLVEKRYEFRLVHMNGSIKHVVVTVDLIPDTTSSIASLIDITDKKTLGGLIPICSSCKKIRNDKGYWEQLELYIRDHSEADFSHGICPECEKSLYPEIQRK
jgi:PAS domain S-box-containing protein